MFSLYLPTLEREAGSVCFGLSFALKDTLSLNAVCSAVCSAVCWLVSNVGAVSIRLFAIACCSLRPSLLNLFSAFESLGPKPNVSNISSNLF